MTKAEVVAYVELFAAPDSDPVVSDAQIDAIVERYRNADDEFEHYALNAATADVWDTKVALVANFHDVTVNGRGLSASQVKAHCEERARWFRRRTDVMVA